MQRRRSIRPKDFDYAQSGAYFVTICTIDRKCFFGEVVKCEMVLNNFGTTIRDCWRWLADQYAYVTVDDFTVMPNHLHGIIWIMGGRRGGSRTAPTARKPLGRLIGAFKTVSSKPINELRKTPGKPVWQRNYFERVIRDEDELDKIREYIKQNPAKWEEDKENPARLMSSITKSIVAP